MSSLTYKSDVSQPELQDEADRTSTLQEVRADALNSGIVKDVSFRTEEALTGVDDALSETFLQDRPKLASGREVNPDVGLDPSSDGAHGFAKAPSIGAYIADSFVVEELDESDELDDAVPAYRGIRSAQRFRSARQARTSQRQSIPQDEALGKTSQSSCASSPRTKALSKADPRTSSLRSVGSRQKKDDRYRSKRQWAARAAETPAAVTEQIRHTVSAKGAVSAKATAATATAATAGTAGFSVAGVVGALFVFVLTVLSIAQIISAIFGFWEDAEAKQSIDGLPPYITYEMVEEALACQEEYGHPAGCTIAQIICESGMGDRMSALATRDHNLFGMKWVSSFAGCPEVVGSASWVTGEEYDGHQVTITDRFIVFAGDRECIRFRSRVFLQASRYRDNALIKEAIESHSSDKMAEGLKEAGWATSSDYVDSLKSVMETYNLYRFDSMTSEDLKNALMSGDAIVQAAYSQLGTPYVWGGTTPNVGLDCSGLTQYCYAQAGISIPRNSEDQHTSGKSIPLSEARPGDILWKPGHVAIFVSEDTYIHAPHTGDVVRVAQGIGYFTCAVSYR